MMHALRILVACLFATAVLAGAQTPWVPDVTMPVGGRLALTVEASDAQGNPLPVLSDRARWCWLAYDADNSLPEWAQLQQWRVLGHRFEPNAISQNTVFVAGRTGKVILRLAVYVSPEYPLFYAKKRVLIVPSSGVPAPTNLIIRVVP